MIDAFPPKDALKVDEKDEAARYEHGDPSRSKRPDTVARRSSSCADDFYRVGILPEDNAYCKQRQAAGPERDFDR